MSKIQLFLQCEGVPHIKLVHVDDDQPARQLIEAAIQAGMPRQNAEGAVVFGPDKDEPLDLDAPLKKQGIKEKHRVHVHRCHKVEVTLHFNEVTQVIKYPPSATVDRVKKHFVHEIRMSPRDATEHVLQLCGKTDRPDPDVQIGSLVCGCCNVCFDLVPIKRVEG